MMLRNRFPPRAPLPPLPTAKEWAEACKLERRGVEWVGACPLCGGDDRFHVQDRTGQAQVGCRGCMDGQAKATRERCFAEALRKVFPERLAENYRPDLLYRRPYA